MKLTKQVELYRQRMLQITNNPHAENDGGLTLKELEIELEKLSSIAKWIEHETDNMETTVVREGAELACSFQLTNYSGFDFSHFSFDINLLDRDDVLVDYYSLSCRQWLQQETADFSFTTGRHDVRSATIDVETLDFDIINKKDTTLSNHTERETTGRKVKERLNWVIENKENYEIDSGVDEEIRNLNKVIELGKVLMANGVYYVVKKDQQGPLCSFYTTNTTDLSFSYITIPIIKTKRDDITYSHIEEIIIKNWHPAEVKEICVHLDDQTAIDISVDADNIEYELMRYE